MSTVVRIEPELGAIANEWDALVAETGMHPFMRPGWMAAWHEAFGRGELEIFAARRDGRLVGVLPLERSSGALVSLSNWHTPEFEPVCADEDVGRDLVAAASQRTRRRLDISFLPRAGSARGLIHEEVEQRARVLVRTIERSPYVQLEGDWPAYEAALTSKRRSDLRRRRRRLTELGELRIGREDGDLSQRLREGLEVEASGWKGEGQTAIAADPSAQRFYERVATWAAAEGLLALWFLRLNDRPIAFAFCLTDQRAHYVLKIGFDQHYARYAPGLALTQEMLKAAFDSGLESYEFLGAEDDYKLIWTDRGHERERLQVFPRAVPGAIEHVAWTHGRPMVKRLLRR